MTSLNRITLVGLAAAALGLASLSLLAWGGSIVDDPGTERGSVEPSHRSPAPASVPAPRRATAPRSGVQWPMAKLMRAIDGLRIRIGSTVVRVDADTTLCSGETPPVTRHGTRFWTRFRCTFTTFGVAGPERDLDFRVHPLGPRRFAVSGARWIGG